MKTLLVDAGNSSLKWALSTSDTSLINQQRIFYVGEPPIKTLDVLLGQIYDQLKAIVMITVLDDDFAKQAEALAKKHSLTFRNIRSQSVLAGVTNGYDEAHKLGVDRFIGMIAAFQQRKAPALIIDVGTATTIDAINIEGHHLGGLIMPGAELCTDSLLNKTALLSRFNTDEVFTPELFSKDTTQAISSASILGLAGAIDVICEKMENKINKHSSQEISRILCGGGAKKVLPYLQGNYQYQESLLMAGLQNLAHK